MPYTLTNLPFNREVHFFAVASRTLNLGMSTVYVLAYSHIVTLFEIWLYGMFIYLYVYSSIVCSVAELLYHQKIG